MNIEYSDLVSQDHIPVTIILLVVFAAAWLYGRKHNLTASNSGTHFIIMVAAIGLSAITLGIGVYGNTQAKPYFERFEAFYDKAAKRSDFWITPELQELADYGTINNAEFNQTSLAGANEAVQMLKRYFPSDDFNVTDLDALRSLKQFVRTCVGREDRADYLRRLSELPVSRSEKNRIQNELRVLYMDEDCSIKPDAQHYLTPKVKPENT